MTVNTSTRPSRCPRHKVASKFSWSHVGDTFIFPSFVLSYWQSFRECVAVQVTSKCGPRATQVSDYLLHTHASYFKQYQVCNLTGPVATRCWHDWISTRVQQTTANQAPLKTTTPPAPVVPTTLFPTTQPNGKDSSVTDSGVIKNKMFDLSSAGTGDEEGQSLDQIEDHTDDNTIPDRMVATKKNKKYVDQFSSTSAPPPSTQTLEMDSKQQPPTAQTGLYRSDQSTPTEAQNPIQSESSDQSTSSSASSHSPNWTYNLLMSLAFCLLVSKAF